MDKLLRELNKKMTEGDITSEFKVPILAGILVAIKNDLKIDKFDGKNDGQLAFDCALDFVKSKTTDEFKIKTLKELYNSLIIDKSWSIQGDKKKSTIHELCEFVSNKLDIYNEDESIDLLGQYYAKYATFDGKDNGIVLTPQYVTELMAKLIGVDDKSVVLDLCTGTGGFILAANEVSEGKIKENLHSIEFDIKMFGYALTNMIIRDIDPENIHKDSAFNVSSIESIKDAGVNKVLLNPPYSYKENGMGFTNEAFKVIEDGALVAIVIQDSTGSGKSPISNKGILKEGRLISSIKMPTDLFMPGAAVQTSIYIIEKGTPHQETDTVRFIDFRNDGYKRTKRSLREVDNPKERYKDIISVFRTGQPIGDIDCVDSTISLNGNDWNYEVHQIYDTIPTEEDFMKTVGDYMMFQIGELLGGR